MKLKTIILSTLLSWTAYDTNLFRRGSTAASATVADYSLSESSDPEQEQKQKKKTNRYRMDVVPKKYRSIKKPNRSKLNYFKIKSRDVRSSNQKKIRRKFNNA